MKRCLIVGLVWGLFGSFAQGTPGQAVRVDERLLGDNAEFFAVLRTEHDNLGSYYKSRTKVFLDERSKATGRSVKEVLIADSTSTIDPYHVDPRTPPKVTTEVEKKDDRVQLGELLVRYRLAADGPADAQASEGFRSVPGRGILYGDFFTLLDEKTVSADVFGGRMEDVPTRLVAVLDDRRSIYLKLAKEDEDFGGSEAHWVTVPPSWAVQVRAHRTKEPVYLSAGAFGTKDAALAKAVEWKDTGKKAGGFDPEIWSAEEDAVKLKFLVVLRGSMDLIRREEFKKIGEALGVTLQPVSSERFREWTEVR